MTDNEIMEAISEALLNLKPEYPDERNARAHRAFGALMSKIGWRSESMVTLENNGIVTQSFSYPKDRLLNFKEK